MEKLILIGNGGHAKSVIDSILSRGDFDVAGIIDKKNGSQNTYKNIPIIGSDDDLESIFRSGIKYAFIAIGSIKSTDLRRRIDNNLRHIGFEIPYIVDEKANVSSSATIDSGVYIGKNVCVNSDVSIGRCSILNTGSIIEHDVTIGDFTHVAPGSVIGGGVVIGSDSLIGLGSKIKHGVKIGDKNIIGMGSVVLDNTPNDVVAFGSPCKVVKRT